MKSLAGHLLVASRKLRDPNFLLTVVYILEHNEDGALGVVLNRQGDRTVREVWEAVNFDPFDCEQHLNMGGPVQGPLIAIHTCKKFADKELPTSGLYVSMQKESVDPLVRQKKHQFRLYTGNSGWGGGQLEGELKVGGWLVTPAKLEDVFADPAKCWFDVTRRIGLSIMLPGFSPEDAPEDPTVN